MILVRVPRIRQSDHHDTVVLPYRAIHVRRHVKCIALMLRVLCMENRPEAVRLGAVASEVSIPCPDTILRIMFISQKVSKIKGSECPSIDGSLLKEMRVGGGRERKTKYPQNVVDKIRQRASVSAYGFCQKGITVFKADTGT